MPSVEEDANNHRGCRHCGIGEWELPLIYRNGYAAFHGDGEARRCHACFMYHERNGVERPSEDWRSELVSKGCANCFEPEPEKPTVAWFGRGNERRCPTCIQYRRNHKQERPESLFAVPPRQPMVKDGCKNPNCMRTEEEMSKGVYSGDDRRCARCRMHTKAHPGYEWPVKESGVVVFHRPVINVIKNGCGNCGKTEEEMGGRGVGSDGDRRCGRCYNHFRNWDREWPEKP